SQSCCSARLKVAAPIQPPSHSCCSNTNSTFSTVTLESRSFSQVTLDFSTEDMLQKAASFPCLPLFYSTVTLEATPACRRLIQPTHCSTAGSAYSGAFAFYPQKGTERCVTGTRCEPNTAS